MSSTPRLILASGSPRRQELFKIAGIPFEVFTRDFDESFSEKLPIREVAAHLATAKNRFYRDFFHNEIIVTADTTVVLDNTILNKPQDEQEAKRMVAHLSGNTHEVFTGVCISSKSKEVTISEQTFVTFHPISPAEIDFYIHRDKPLDKAGAYGVQDWLGLIKVKELRGSFYNVMGLPIDRVYEVLKTDFGFNLPQ